MPLQAHLMKNFSFSTSTKVHNPGMLKNIFHITNLVKTSPQDFPFQSFLPTSQEVRLRTEQLQLHKFSLYMMKLGPILIKQ